MPGSGTLWPPELVVVPPDEDDEELLLLLEELELDVLEPLPPVELHFQAKAGEAVETAPARIAATTSLRIIESPLFKP